MVDGSWAPSATVDIGPVFSESSQRDLRFGLSRAIVGQAGPAAELVASVLSQHVQLAILMMTSSARYEDVILIGQDAGTIGLHVVGDDSLGDNTAGTCGLAIEPAIAATRPFDPIFVACNSQNLADPFHAFIEDLGHELQERGVLVTRTVPAPASKAKLLGGTQQPHSEGLETHADEQSRSARTKIVPRAWFSYALAGVFVLLVVAFGAIWIHRHWASSRHLVGVAPVSGSSASLPDRSSSGGVNGVSFRVGGQGTGDTSDLGAMGIKVGHEAANDIANSKPSQ